MTSLNPVKPIPRWTYSIPILLIILLTPLDGWFVSAVPEDTGHDRGDLMSLLRILGYMPTWFGISLLLLAALPPTERRKKAAPALSLTLTPMVAGAVAEALKPVFRRPDPIPGNVETWQRAPLGQEWWDGTDFCFPSGHSAVAFGAALAISRRWPGTTPWIFLAAAGCAMTRVLELGHHPTDVIASLLIAMLVSHWIEPVICNRVDIRS